MDLSAKLMVLGLFLATLAGCNTDVKTGEIMTCKHCGKEIKNTVRTISVRRWDADEYSVKETAGYCEKCGNEVVAYKVRICCEQCGAEYAQRTETAPRKEERHDTSLREGYCSTNCERMARVGRGLDRASEAIGDGLGRIGKGLYKGIRKHLR